MVSCLTPTVFQAPGVPPERLALLARGINLNAWFTPWANPLNYQNAFHPQEAAFLRKAGFTVCRLPMDPDLLFDSAHPETPAPAIRYVDRAVHMLLSAGLAVIVDPLHGDSSNAAWESRLYHDASFRSKAETYWEALARHFSAFSKDRIFFEVMNEPHLSAREKVDPSWWQPVQVSLAAAIRRGAPSNTIIATGERWGGIDGLLELKPLADRNVVYSFHSYDPFTFTHQGAEWAGPLQAELAGIPYPSTPAAVQAPAAALPDPRARDQVLRYGDESWNEERVRTGLSRAAEWASAHRVPVFCGEFGAYRKSSAETDRLAWIGDVRRSLEALNIGWCMWDYETDFGIVTFSEPSWRRGIQVDADYLSALGLDERQTIGNIPGEPTVEDFWSGTAQALLIPVNDWTRLWTREQGVGSSEVVEDDAGMPIALHVDILGSQDWAIDSGLRVPVTAGEKLRLSSHASLAGSGALRLELVARDSQGTVVDWSYAAMSVGTGPVRTYTTDFTVSSGIASLEPRWSGEGPARVRVEAFELDRRT